MTQECKHVPCHIRAQPAGDRQQTQYSDTSAYSSCQSETPAVRRWETPAQLRQHRGWSRRFAPEMGGSRCTWTAGKRNQCAAPIHTNTQLTDSSRKFPVKSQLLYTTNFSKRQGSSDYLPFYLQTTIIAQMLSITEQTAAVGILPR